MYKTLLQHRGVSAIAKRHELDCGDIIQGNCTIADKGQELFELILCIASGEASKSEDLGFGGVEFVSWQIDAVM